MTTIPNELIININTGVPGYQKIRYSPSMTIKNISKDNNKIYFYPLIKLNKNIIDKVPEDLRKKQFFNKGLFDSLLNYTGNNPVKTLKQATAIGYVDNNIKATLDTIFSENSILYVGGKPYVILDTQWSNGDWKIDTKKKKEELDSSKITDPMLYQAIVKDEIISGEQELELLNKNIIYGPNYNGPKNQIDVENQIDTKKTIPIATNVEIAHGIKQKQQISSITPSLTPSSTEVVPFTKPDTTSTEVVPFTKPDTTSTEVVPFTKPDTTSTEIVPFTKPDTTIETQPRRMATPKEIKQIMPPEEDEHKFEILHDNTDKQPISKSVEIPLVIEPINKLVTDPKTKIFKSTIGSTSFYDIVNFIYKTFNNDVKKKFNDILLNTTTIGVKQSASNLSRTSYNQLVEGVKIVSNTGKGDCFFIAVADAINYYNYYNQNTRIISGIYGTGQNLFTPLYLRNLVYNFLVTWPELDDTILNIAPVNAKTLNQKFKESIDGLKDTLKEEGRSVDIPVQTYLELAENIYIQNENFLIKNVTRIPFDLNDYDNPFKVIDKSELKEYILSSNYWADINSITALCEKLKLNIIPIQIKSIDKTRRHIYIPGANFEKTYNKWNKYLFLYFNNAHYDLMTFNFNIKYEHTDIETGRLIGIRKKTIKKTIFDRVNNYEAFPPLFIIVIIYGAFYSTIKNINDKKNFTFYNQLMEYIDSSIASQNNSSLYLNFYTQFTNFFPYNKLHKPLYDATLENVDKTDTVVGGAYNPYYSQTIPGQTMPAYKMIKKEYNTDNSHLGYYVTIDLELHPGTSISPEEMKHLKCRQKWNKVRKSWSDFTGKPYVISPVYQTKTVKNKELAGGNKTQYKKSIIQNNTRKYSQTQLMPVGNKTRKKL